MEQNLICAVPIAGNKPGQRIGYIKWYEMGYYPANAMRDILIDKPEWSFEEVQKQVQDFNGELGISPKVGESAFEASMFGWHCRCADPAIEFFKLTYGA